MLYPVENIKTSVYYDIVLLLFIVHYIYKGPSWLLTYGSWNYNYMYLYVHSVPIYSYH